MHKKHLNICVAGVSGYVGNELIKLVKAHPHLQLAGFLDVREQGLTTALPGCDDDYPIYTINELRKGHGDIDVLCLATPPQISIDCISVLHKKPLKIIDLSGAFRLPTDDLKAWYGLQHDVESLSSGATYGLSPWANQSIEQAPVIANPGCYATCALMALLPLLQYQVIQSTNIIIDAKSGVTGAGKSPNANLMLAEMLDNFFPYKVGNHQHVPEINQCLAHFTDSLFNVILNTQLLPIKRGIAMTVYCDASDSLAGDEEIMKIIQASYETCYGDYPLIKFHALNQGLAQQDKAILSLNNVVGTPFTHVGYFVKEGKVFLYCCIDNLLKGAASQAIENINLSYQWPLATGLV